MEQNKAVVKEIQVGGYKCVHSLWEACKAYCTMIETEEIHRDKLIFFIKLPNGEIKQITIRDADNETVAYGDFEGLPDFLDYAKEVCKERKL